MSLYPALVVYDWLVTLSREVHLFWTGKVRPLPAVLYLANKYTNLLACFLNVLQMAPMPNKVRTNSPSCHVILNRVFLPD